MPAPRAVLRDIHDLGLDPAGAHTTDKGGRLKQYVPPAAPVKNALKELPKEPEKKTEEVVVVKRSKLAATPAAPVPAPESVKAAEAVKPVEKPTEEVKPVEVKAETKAEEKPAEEKPAS